MGKGWIIAAGVVALSGAGAWASEAPARRATDAPPPETVVVELFTAQGCSGCPQANEMIEALADQPGVIALTYAVDYWDYLGWPDTFAQPAFAERQRAYQARLRLRDIYTPQVVIDGAQQASGVRETEVRALVVEEAAQRSFPPEVEFRESGDAVGIGSGRPPEGGADVWLVRFQPGPQTVQVRQGENRGQSVRHANVVRAIERIGDWTGRPVLLPLDPVPDDLSLAVLVQGRDDGRILAAAVR